MSEVPRTQSEEWLPMRHGAGLRVTGEPGHRALELVASVAGQQVVMGHVPLFALINHLMPEAGFTVTRDAVGDHLVLNDAPVCVGGPFDGRRFLKAHTNGHVIRVPVRDPQWFKVTDEPPTAFASVLCGEYRLTRIESAFGTLRELWWWTPEVAMAENNVPIVGVG